MPKVGNMKLKFFILSLFLFTSFSLAQALYKNAGTSSNLFLRLGVSPRVSGMGETFTAIANDENTLLYNTAGLAKPLISGVAFNHTQWFEDIRIENLLFTYRMGGNLGLGFGILYMGMPSIQGVDEYGFSTNEDISVSSSIIQLGLGYEVLHGTMIGMSAKYYNDNLAGVSAGGFAIDAGVLIETMIRGLNIGLAIQNYGSKSKYDVFNEKPPITIRAGVAYKIPMQDLRFGLDIVKSTDQDYQFNLGTEYIVADYIVLRLGNQAISGKILSPSYGLGINFKDKYLVDYTFANHENLGSIHRAGITFRFKLPTLLKGGRSTRRPSVIVMAPRGLRYEIINEALIIKWIGTPGASYNVYARTNKNEPWKKITKKPLSKTEMEFKRPLPNKKYYITVTAILNNFESAFENEIEIDIK